MYTNVSPTQWIEQGPEILNPQQVIHAQRILNTVSSNLHTNLSSEQSPAFGLPLADVSEIRFGPRVEFHKIPKK